MEDKPSGRRSPEGCERIPPPVSLPGWMNPVLRLPAAVYGSAVAVRNYLFDKDVLTTRRVPIPVISVGNITAGGTGKTPCTIWLAKRLARWGRRPAVVSRGYGGREGSSPVRVPPGGDARRFGDEPVLMASECPDVPVIVSRDRYRGAVWAMEHAGAGCVILDDGFQHRKLRRDVDIVLINAAEPVRCNGLLPAGTLREPLRGLRRAHAVIFTHTERSSVSPEEHALIRRFNSSAEVFYAAHRPRVFRRWGEKAALSVEEMPGPAGLVSAIGDPEGFVRSVAQAGVEVCCEIRYPDHRRLDDAVWKASESDIRRMGGACLITTAKDEARTSGPPPVTLPVFVLDIVFEIRDSDRFEAWLKEMLDKSKL